MMIFVITGITATCIALEPILQDILQDTMSIEVQEVMSIEEAIEQVKQDALYTMNDTPLLLPLDEEQIQPLFNEVKAIGLLNVERAAWNDSSLILVNFKFTKDNLHLDFGITGQSMGVLCPFVCILIMSEVKGRTSRT